jgi:LmbE family N-acetylglucosaminyl deacetylase
MRQIFTFAALLTVVITALAQRPSKPASSEIYHEIQKLNFLGSVLYIAAHPDDENTRLISYFANEKKYRTGYLSLTRGDGGQNLIGTQLRELLGVVRTQELLEARRIDGGEQFFTRANDFGFSKTPDETLKIWDKDQVLADVIWQIRKFRPDVIINRFDHRSPGTTHGHHTASAMLSLEASELAADPKKYSSQLTLVDTWKPQRVLFNTSWWFYGSQEKFEQADKSKHINLQTGVYYSTLGKSNQEIAALSRSCHKSQGFGSMGARGEDNEYLELIKGSMPADKQNLFEGIDTSWNRIPGGSAIGVILSKVEREFDFRAPSKSIPELLRAYQLLQKLDENHWKPIKLEAIRNIIASCAGLYLEAVAERQDASPGDAIKISVEAINRSDVSMVLNALELTGTGQIKPEAMLGNNQRFTSDVQVVIPRNQAFTQPYWLEVKGTEGMYVVNDQQNIGKPDVIRDAKAIFTISVNNVPLTFERKIVYKFKDDVKGEVYRPFDIVPAVTASITEKVTIYSDNNVRKVAVKVKAGNGPATGNVKLTLPSNWKVSPAAVPFQLNNKGAEEIVHFMVTPPSAADEATAQVSVVVGDQEYRMEQIAIDYDHISFQQVLKPAEARLIKLDIKTGQEKIAYIMGAGDVVPASLSQMGYDVTLLKTDEILPERLAAYNVVMTGIRAYNVLNDLAHKQEILFDFVKKGGTMIVQYNTSQDLVTKQLAPYPLTLSRERVTEEDAEVRFLEPQSRILNTPNKISVADFKGWKQEQGLYYPNQWDPAFTAIISSNDQGETPKNGGLLVAQYGKGHYIYTGLSLFRELPEGVPGAFRILANMISISSK